MPGPRPQNLNKTEKLIKCWRWYSTRASRNEKRPESEQVGSVRTCTVWVKQKGRTRNRNFFFWHSCLRSSGSAV
ncbi:hypothetical protein AMATHDRAFT_67506 [Amanita thiersii Skay4041]|uniref:Uncharacterized protein n=1 Tax=Amanita thiersii Skay4041 TaxID=703135 RepID=A0A2A9NH65_9AGAR|nr:hypothetical protein AMATHDRAFT_67506 [Amanita thiersii Skay4041]